MQHRNRKDDLIQIQRTLNTTGGKALIEELSIVLDPHELFTAEPLALAAKAARRDVFKLLLSLQAGVETDE